MPHFSHILWDWNGTLLDDSAVCVATLNGVLEDHQLEPIELARYREIFEFPVHSFYRSLNQALSDDTLRHMSNQFVSNYEAVWRNCSLHPETIDILNYFQAQGSVQNILSASNQTTLNACLDHYGLSGFFESIIGQDNCHAHGKLETGRCWLEKTQVNPEMVLLVGDTLHDLEIAQTLGFQCALYAGGHNSRLRLERAHTWVLDSLTELKDL